MGAKNKHRKKQCFFLLQVAGLFRDPSIGNAINIVVVRLILLEQDEVKHVLFYDEM